jgi:hypothetical protein
MKNKIEQILGEGLVIGKRIKFDYQYLKILVS